MKVFDKVRIKYIARFIVGLLIVLLSIKIAYDCLKWKDTTGDYLSVYEQLYNTPDDTIDVVFVGTSHVFCGIYPCQLWEDYGMAAFDMSVSGMDKTSSYYGLKELLKTQSPKVVAIDVYSLLFDEMDVEANEYRNLLGMKTSKNSMDLVSNYPYIDEDTEREYIFRWPIIHTRYTELTKYDFVDYEPSKYGRGAFYTWSSNGSETPDLVALQNAGMGELSETNKEWLDSLVELSHEEDFELIFFVAPALINTEQQTVINAASAYASASGIPFYDCSAHRDELSIQDQVDYLDSDHLNAYGAAKLTKYLGDIISENYQIVDRRNDDNYSLWHKDLEYYNHLKLASEMENTDSVSAILDKAITGDDLFVMVSVEGIGAWMNNADQLINYGIFSDDGNMDAKWLYTESGFVKILDYLSTDELVYNLEGDDIIKVMNNGQFSGNNIIFNGEGYSNSGSSVEVLVYDRMLKKVICRKEY